MRSRSMMRRGFHILATEAALSFCGCATFVRNLSQSDDFSDFAMALRGHEHIEAFPLQLKSRGSGRIATGHAHKDEKSILISGTVEKRGPGWMGQRSVVSRKCRGNRPTRTGRRMLSPQNFRPHGSRARNAGWWVARATRYGCPRSPIRLFYPSRIPRRDNRTLPIQAFHMSSKDSQLIRSSPVSSRVLGRPRPDEFAQR